MIFWIILRKTITTLTMTISNLISYVESLIIKDHVGNLTRIIRINAQRFGGMGDYGDNL
jgi:predicted DNA-binding ribbon-helix-helix protein